MFVILTECKDVQISSQIMTTRIAGGLLLGYNPRVPGQGLKPLA